MSPAVIEPLTQSSLPTRKPVRQLRWFETSVCAQMSAVSTQTGQHYDRSDQRLIDTPLIATCSGKPFSERIYDLIKRTGPN